MKLDVLNIQGKSTGRSIELPEEIFGIEPNPHAVYLAVKQYNAAQRQGTHKAKERWEISRTTKKLKRQKGTGTARAGSMKSPVFRGGGRAFGPKPRNYSFKLNKKVKELARYSALADKLATGAMIVFEDFTLNAPSTKEYKNILNNLQVTGKSLLLTADNNQNVYLSGRNLPKSEVQNVKDANTYQIINADVLLISENSVNQLRAAYEQQ
ncbi:MAG: 50S ribosomal protein L4 [Saprospiraceae bacterium]|nr:50S ribosomal protein L4 [Saprospiraceae bacterium]MBK8669459.1 50S ribosomal protein L4 [Saprospiraceae bacterium]MBL0100793.1 50S ribosomal protein L4 [Saprospiraceae bacterium]